MGIAAAIGVPATAALAAAGIGGATSLAGGLISSGAQTSAAQTESQAALQAAQIQANAGLQAEQTQVQGVNASLQELAPFVQAGTGAENQLANLYGIPYAATGSGQPSTSSSGIVTPANVNAAVSSPGGQAVQNAAFANFANTPNYQFAFDQGLQALERSANAAGTLISGGQLKGAEEFGQGLATQQYQNYVSGLQALAGTGQNAAAGTASNALSGANSIGNTQQAVGQSIASGQVGSANAIAGGVTGSASALTSGLNGVSSSVMNSLLLSRLGGSSPSGYAANSTPTSLASYLPSYVGGLNNSWTASDTLQ
jgi:hypothetical protein